MTGRYLKIEMSKQVIINQDKNYDDRYDNYYTYIHRKCRETSVGEVR